MLFKLVVTSLESAIKLLGFKFCLYYLPGDDFRQLAESLFASVPSSVKYG